jgi:hypothetical protein
MNYLRMAKSFTRDEAIAWIRGDGKDRDGLRDHQKVEIYRCCGDVLRSRGNRDPAIVRK